MMGLDNTVNKLTEICMAIDNLRKECPDLDFKSVTRLEDGTWRVLLLFNK